MPDPWQLDWGKVTTEFYHEQLRLALHVFNHNLESEENVGRTIRFITARLKWFQRHLPTGSRQAIRFDEKGQEVPGKVKQVLRDVLGSRVTSIVFTSEPPK